MALTIAVTRRITAGDQHIVTGTIAFDNSYPTVGESFTAANLGLRTVDLMLLQHTAGFSYQYDYTNSKVLVYTQGVAHGAAGAVTLDDYPVTAGPGATASSSISREASATSPLRMGPMKEIANTDDLSTVTGVRFVCFGV